MIVPIGSQLVNHVRIVSRSRVNVIQNETAIRHSKFRLFLELENIRSNDAPESFQTFSSNGILPIRLAAVARLEI